MLGPRLSLTLLPYCASGSPGPAERRSCGGKKVSREVLGVYGSKRLTDVDEPHRLKV